MFDKKLYFIFGVIALVSLLVGWQIGREPLKNELKESQKMIEVLKSNLEMFYPPLPEEIKSILGKVIEIKEKTILVEASIRVSRFPLPEGEDIEKKNIKVIVTDQTEITKRELTEPLLPEEIGEIKEKPLVFSDIKVGDNISVFSEENIKGKTEIIASQIKKISD